MNGEIDLLAEQRVFDFLHEQPLAADFREGRFLQAIARGLDDNDPARRRAGGRQPRGDGVRLPQRKLTATGAETELNHLVIWYLVIG